MFKKIISISFIFAIAFNSLISTFILGEYLVNKSEIIELFCINKEETTFKCDGQCHLKSQIKKAEGEKETNSPKWMNENPFTFVEIDFEELSIPNLSEYHKKYFEIEFDLPLIEKSISVPPPKLS